MTSEAPGKNFPVKLRSVLGMSMEVIETVCGCVGIVHAGFTLESFFAEENL